MHDKKNNNKSLDSMFGIVPKNIVSIFDSIFMEDALILSSYHFVVHVNYLCTQSLSELAEWVSDNVYFASTQEAYEMIS